MTKFPILTILVISDLYLVCEVLQISILMFQGLECCCLPAPGLFVLSY